MLVAIKKLIDHFEDGDIYIEDNIHKTLLTIMLWYVYSEPDYWQAVRKFKVFNTARNRHEKGGLEKSAITYRETETIFWARELHKLCVSHKKTMDFEDIRALMLATGKFFVKGYIYEFYSKDLLDSEEARTLYFEPDLMKGIELSFLRSTREKSIEAT